MNKRYVTTYCSGFREGSDDWADALHYHVTDIQDGQRWFLDGIEVTVREFRDAAHSEQQVELASQYAAASALAKAAAAIEDEALQASVEFVLDDAWGNADEVSDGRPAEWARLFMGSLKNALSFSTPDPHIRAWFAERGIYRN